MAEAGLLTDVGIVFDLAWIYVPILGTAFMPLIPAPSWGITPSKKSATFCSSTTLKDMA